MQGRYNCARVNPYCGAARWTFANRLILLVVAMLHAAAVLAQGTQQSVENSIEFLRQRMDEFHGRFGVYEDVSSAGNHFAVFGIIPDASAPVSMNGSWAVNPRSGATCIQFKLTPRHSSDSGGFYFLNGVLPNQATAPQLNLGTAASAGINLTGATHLTFWARGETGTEIVDFFMGGVGRDAVTGAATSPYPDSTPAQRITKVALSTQWTQHTIPLTGLDLTYIIGGFGWAANALANPSGATFYVDDIQYELSPAARQARLNEPRFLRSYVTAAVQPNVSDTNTDDDFDLVLRNTAFTYDNALAILAFLAHGSADSLRRARLIGDALVYAANNDRYYTDGRLRNAYSAGDLKLPPGWTPNNRVGTVPVPGYFDENHQRFYEIGQDSIATGNNAWVMIAMLALYRTTGDPNYLSIARRLGDFIRTFRNDQGAYQGFLGGQSNPESNTPVKRTYASTEHNLDIYAAFRVMGLLTTESEWNTQASHASAFVAAMYDSSRRCYLTGTLDQNTRNTLRGQLPLDVQAWSILSLREGISSRFGALFGCLGTHHLITSDGFTGYDFNEDRDGVWFEGTAHVAAARAQAGNLNEAEVLRAVLRDAQSRVGFGGGFGLPAASRDLITTGFGFKLYRRLHVGATAWNVYAQLGVNPYYFSPLRFPAIVAARPGTQNTSAPLTVTWITTPTTMTVKGGLVSINGGARTSGPVSVKNGDTLRIHLSAPKGFATKACASIALGVDASEFCVTTVPTPAPILGLIVNLLSDG